MKTKKSLFAKIINVIAWICLLIGIIYAYKCYQKNNFNDFIRGELLLGNSTFKRDNIEKYSKSDSYKITSNNYNDAMFYKTIKVEKNTPYKVKCMVKTNSVQSENNLVGSGAQIAIEDSTERSVAITGTTDWQEIEFIFNSKNREEVNVGFRLGGYIDNCIGEAWFSDFTIEQGIADTSNEWKFACFIFETVDVVIDGKEVNLSLMPDDVRDIQQTIIKFSNSCYEMSERKMKAECEVYTVSKPITTLSYDEEFGYYVSDGDVEEHIKGTINENDYDHIFIIVRLGDDEHIDDIQIKDWIGLGSMDYYGIGFSNIRLPNSSSSALYKNDFPEEVYIHEFLHSLERTLLEYDYDIPALHDYEKYGYKTLVQTGLKDWYYAYMNKTIETSAEDIGLDPIVYTLKPAKSSNFEFSYKLENVFTEPRNIFEEISQLIKNVSRNVKLLIGQNEE